jgi:hypothetical protein
MSRKKPSPWRNGRLFVEVTEEHIREGLEKNSSHCIVAMAIGAALPHCRHISIDLQSCRLTDPKKRLRYTFLTPHAAREIVINTDQGERDKLVPCTFSMKPAIIAQSGKKRRATPTPEQLKGSGLRVAPDQPHVPGWQERHLAASAVIVNGGPDEPEPKRRKRQPRALVSAVKNGEIPTVLGGRPFPTSILNRREYGLRALRR